MKTIIISVLLLTTGLLTLQAQNAREIAQKSADAIKLESMEMAATLNIHDGKGNVRVRQVANASKKFGETVKTMIRFLAPPDVAGTTMLIYDYETKDDDMWVYLPAMRNTRRIVSSEKGKNFMGSEFTNADMSKPNLDDYNYQLLGSQTLNGVECWKVESESKTKAIADQNGFAKKVAWIEKGNYLPHQVDYYDQTGNKFKEMTIGDYRKQSNGNYFAFRMEMKNLRNSRRSEMIVDRFQIGSKLSEADFSSVNLGK
jgi:outer membrane lipoprotein-sorting protein